MKNFIPKIIRFDPLKTITHQAGITVHQEKIEIHEDF